LSFLKYPDDHTTSLTNTGNYEEEEDTVRKQSPGLSTAREKDKDIKMEKDDIGKGRSRDDGYCPTSLPCKETIPGIYYRNGKR
jgi:hypothetical protein